LRQEGLAVYVERYAVKLPEPFLDHARRKRFVMAKSLNESAVQDAELDLSFWDHWCEQQQWQQQPVRGLKSARRWTRRSGSAGSGTRTARTPAGRAASSRG
jgi:hypothetical protein